MSVPEWIAELFLGVMLGLVAWAGHRQVKRLDRVEQMAMTAASIKQVEQEIDRAVTTQIREVREDMRELRAIVIKALERRD